ncbi:MAG TPA: AI-2E family transporter [Casimicrobiaceae bacterium]|nr:AI-2E family transporter [Casimicrobiaceae bacterium]
MADRPPQETWFTRERLLVMVLMGASVVVGWLCWRLVQPFVPPITWALVLAVLAHPMHGWLTKRVRWPSVAAGLAVVVVTIAIAIPATLVVRQIGTEAVESVANLRALATEDRWKVVFERFPQLQPIRDWIASEVDVPEKVGEASTQVAKTVRDVFKRAVDLSMAVLVTLFLLFYFLRDKDRILRAVQSFVPLAPAETMKVRQRVRDTIGAVVFGTLVVAVVQGTLGGLMFWWLGLPAPILWGAIMALLAVLPMFGAALVWIPAAIYLAVSGDWGKALLLTAWGTIVVGLIDNLIGPLVMKGRLHMHTVPVFIAVLGGVFAFGATGFVLGPLIFAVALALVDIWKRRMAVQS